MVNYNNGKIYKIESHLGDLVYIGSTTKQYLSQRMDCHRTAYKRWKNDKCRLTTSFKVFEEYGVENCSIVLIESYPCESKDELRTREGYYIKTIDCVNKNIAGRTKKQYRLENRDKYMEYLIHYRLENRDKIIEQKKQHYQENRERLLEQKNQYRLENRDKIIEQKKQHYQENRERLLEQKKKYRLENRDKINERRSEKYECECGIILTLRHKSRHEKSTKHINFINSST
jgi:hypothetical protein